MNGNYKDFENRQVASLPDRLRVYRVEQHYEQYTPIDQAVWRYVMRQNYFFLKDLAYYPYIPGLKKAGLTIERIPDLQQMNDALGEIGWGAVTVDGFIPPAAFMEYQEYHVLVIAADIRQLKHIDYTPAPDILHESAGHAPIIAEPDYNRYLSYFGSVGAKAMFSSGDFELYEAIRELSILKEMPGADSVAIQTAEQKVKFCQENLGSPSEMALLSRLHWWTVEYGLIGTPEDPKIYGAGLLSSIGESATCMHPSIKKIEYSLDAVHYSYDITNQQPQLFVTPDFKRLTEVLDEFSATMAFKTGGASGIEKAISSGKTATAVYSSGLQVSGRFASQYLSSAETSFIRVTGPTVLSFDNKQLDGHGADYHREGYSSPVGRLVNSSKDLEDYKPADLENAGISIGKIVALQFESGISLTGRLVKFTMRRDKLLILTFDACTVTATNGDILFDPSWGVYDMGIGSGIVSVFPGLADKSGTDDTAAKPSSITYHPVYTQQERDYQQLFERVRKWREEGGEIGVLEQIYTTIVAKFDDDWLCLVELFEILMKENDQPQLCAEVLGELERRSSIYPDFRKLIADGIHLANRKEI